jgi:hypothetical protein
MPAANLRVKVLEEPDAAAGPVGRKLEEVELVRDLERAREVGQENEARLERRNEQRVRGGVVASDLRAQLGDAASDLLAREVDLADAVRGYDARPSLYRSARRAMSRL